MSYSIKRGDRRPPFTSTLEAPIDTPIDLTGCTVKFLMAAKDSPYAVKVDAAATIVSAVDGTVSYAWGATDTDTIGTYEAEWEITYGDGTKMTVPGDSYLYVRVVRDVA